MDKAIEEEIIKKYVISNKQERIIWELNSPKKREGVVVRRFTRPNIFKQTCLYYLLWKWHWILSGRAGIWSTAKI